MNAYIDSQFGYRPLVWMMHSRTLHRKTYRKIQKYTEKYTQYMKMALRIVYQDDTLTFEELLNKDNFVKIHIQNLQVLATEIFKVKNGIAS